MKKGEATRARILEEAARQAALRGLTGVSLNDVAEAVGLSKSGLFKHFESKEAMQLAVLQATLERFADYVWAPASILPPGRGRLTPRAPAVAPTRRGWRTGCIPA